MINKLGGGVEDYYKKNSVDFFIVLLFMYLNSTGIFKNLRMGYRKTGDLR